MDQIIHSSDLPKYYYSELIKLPGDKNLFIAILAVPAFSHEWHASYILSCTGLANSNAYHVWTTFGLELVTLLEEVITLLISISSQ